MESQGGANDDNKESEARPLARQKSLYNLTLDEVQNHLDDAKPLCSLNLDELLQNVWTAEASLSDGINDEAAVTANQTALQYQASLSLTSELSKRSVNDIWRAIQENKNNEQQKSQERQTSLGEITLEEFLAEAGIFAESSARSTASPSNVAGPNLAPQPSQENWSQYPQGMTGDYMLYQPLQPEYQHPHGGVEGYILDQPTSQPVPAMDELLQENMAQVLPPMMGTQSDANTPDRKRGQENAESLAEKKHKRMLRNRESAARSREKKQAYLTELERKVSDLQETNARLRMLKEFDDSMPSPETRYQLRRTSSL